MLGRYYRDGLRTAWAIKRICSSPGGYDIIGAEGTRERNSDTLFCMNSPAAVYELLGQWEESGSLFEKALALRTAVLGENDVDTLATRGYLRSVYKELGRDCGQI